MTVVSILRLQSLLHFSNSLNPTWDQWDVANWSTVEMNVGIICLCMPALRQLLVRFFPRMLGTGNRSAAQGTAAQIVATPADLDKLRPGRRRVENDPRWNDQLRLVCMTELDQRSVKTRSEHSISAV